VKTLRKGDEFKRVKSSNKKDYAAIQKLRESGWEFCDKTTWRRHSGKNEEEDGE
jgi:hypothetical protein